MRWGDFTRLNPIFFYHKSVKPLSVQTFDRVVTPSNLAIDRRQWKNINLLMVSVICSRRAIPLNWSLLPHLGNSNKSEQESVLSPVLSRFKDYQIVVLGDREFCSLNLAAWLEERNIGFCLRLKENTCLEVENLIWQRLDELGISSGVCFYYQGQRIRKTQPVSGLALAAKCQRSYRGQTAKEPWYILTNLGSLTVAIQAYKRRMGIEEMFRDCKSGGYNERRHRIKRRAIKRKE